MTIEEALTAIGVSESLLSEEEKTRLDEDGFLPIEGVLSQTQIDELRTRLDELLAIEGEDAGKEVHQEAGTDRLSNLVNKGKCFRVCISHPKVLSAIAYVLQGDMKLSSLNARFAKPGEGKQGLHADWGRLETPGEYQVCNSIWLLDDFTPDNGATRVVPGSQRLGNRAPSDEMADTTAAHPNEKLILGKAGTVVVFNSHTWHGGTLNRTASRRRALHSYYARRHNQQQLDMAKHLSPETVADLPEALRVIVGV